MDQEKKLTDEMLKEVTGGNYSEYNKAMQELCEKYECSKGELSQHITKEEQQKLWDELLK